MRNRMSKRARERKTSTDQWSSHKFIVLHLSPFNNFLARRERNKDHCCPGEKVKGEIERVRKRRKKERKKERDKENEGKENEGERRKEKR